MYRISKFLFLFILFPLAAVAQSTVVSGTIQDTSGTVWANARITTVFQQAPGVPGPYIWSGGSFNPTPADTFADGSGNFSISLPSNTSITPTRSTWLFVFTPQSNNPACPITVAVTGATQNISSTISTTCISVKIQSTPFPRSYSDTQVVVPPNSGQVYYNTTSNTHRSYNGFSWVDMEGGGGGGSVPICPTTITSSCAITSNWTTATTIASNNIQIQCLNGAQIVQQSSTPIITVTGTNVVFNGCVVNTNGQANQTIEVNAATNFAFVNGSVVNTSTTVGNYGIRVDHTSGMLFFNNNCNTPYSNCFQSFDSSNGIITSNQGIGHIGIASSSGAPAVGTNWIVVDNNLAPSKGSFAIEIGDFSNSNFPIDNLTFANNVCNITTASTSANSVHGCYSIVAHVSKCALTGNSVKAINQWFTAPPFEIGVDDCSIIGNSITAPDTNNQGYNGLTLYGGGNTVVGTRIRGWGATGDGIQLYCQTPGGTSHTCDNNLYASNIIIGHNQTNSGGISGAFGIELQCNVPGSTMYNQKLIGNMITTDAGTIARGVNAEDDHTGPPDTCPGNVFIDNQMNANVTRDVQVNIPISMGKIDSTNVPLATFTTSTPATVTIPANVSATGVIPTGLTASVQGLCYPTAGSPITNTGCAAINAGQVVFTPTAVGWYRIINGGYLGINRGYVDIFSYYGGSNYPATRINFALSAFGSSSVRVDNTAIYGGNYGAIDQVRSSTNNAGAIYLDIHISTITGVAPITMVFYGLAINTADIVASPVVGAVVGSADVRLVNYNTFSTNPAVPPVSLADSGLHYADTFNATGGGFQYQGAAPSGHVLIGNGIYYVDSTLPTQTLAGNVNTSSGTSDAVTITGVSATSTCVFSAFNAGAATNIATTYISSVATNTVTITHAAIGGMVYTILCKP